MTKILLVDDSRVEHYLAAGLLTKIPDVEIDFAQNGREALDAVNRSPPDLVVTDLIMPEMDGLKLTEALRKSHPEIPVILMTAYGDEMTTVEALEKGAASYVPKSRQAEYLPDAVNRVLARSLADQARAKLMGGLAHFECSFALENDPRLITPLVDYVQRAMAGVGVTDATGRIRVAIALEEALYNALYHGNLEIDSDALADARMNPTGEALRDLVDDHRSKSDERALSVEVEISKHEGARFVVKDGGRGFDPVKTNCSDLEDCFQNGLNRGLMLMRSLVDEVAYNNTGNEVSLFKRSDSFAN
ncbi:MAG: response regulator [Planctomycetales bacterium]